ncbi:hypothetical protein QQM79_16720 [Marinobacteraceae bacterium S3BR75-40.1]
MPNRIIQTSHPDAMKTMERLPDCKAYPGQKAWKGRRGLILPELEESRQACAPIALARAHKFLRAALQESPALALAIRFPTTPTLENRAPREADLHSRRQYLDLLLREMRLLKLHTYRHCRLTHLWWLGHPPAWLEPAQMTELMFRTGQQLNDGLDYLEAATLCVDKLVADQDTWALVRGLGFTHIVSQAPPTEALAALVSEFELSIVPDVFHSPMPRLNEVPLVGIGLGARSFFGRYCIDNLMRLDLYRSCLDRGQYPYEQARICSVATF